MKPNYFVSSGRMQLYLPTHRSFTLSWAGCKVTVAFCFKFLHITTRSTKTYSEHHVGVDPAFGWLHPVRVNCVNDFSEQYTASVCSSETSATKPTLALCKHPKAGSTSITKSVLKLKIKISSI
jgi:hypothetical protein